jgi:hypothetical protein
MSTEKLNIIDGPTADRMIDSFKYTFTRGCAIPVTFRVNISPKRSQVVTLSIVALSYESGKPGAFNFRASITSGGKGIVNGFYDASDRAGWFKHD